MFSSSFSFFSSSYLSLSGLGIVGLEVEEKLGELAGRAGMVEVGGLAGLAGRAGMVVWVGGLAG